MLDRKKRRPQTCSLETDQIKKVKYFLALPPMGFDLTLLIRKDASSPSGTLCNPVRGEPTMIET